MNGAAGDTGKVRRWSQEVMRHSSAPDLEENVFAQEDPKQIAKSLQRLAGGPKDELRALYDHPTGIAPPTCEARPADLALQGFGQTHTLKTLWKLQARQSHANR